MKNLGAVSLGDFNNPSDGTICGLPAAGFAGLRSLTLQARFAYGGGGATCKAYLQTSIDQGQTWCDIACFAFGVAPATSIVNLPSDTPLVVPTAPGDGSLADNTAIAGPLGDRLRVKVVTTGAYTDSTLLSVWGVAR